MNEVARNIAASGADYPGADIRVAPPKAPARIIQSDAEAIAVAHEVATELERDAALRDRDRRLPFAELELYSQSGLWAIRLPREFGGADASFATVANVFSIIAAADPSIAQMAQSHNSAIHLIRKVGTPEQKQFFLKAILRGHRLGSAAAEFGRTSETKLRTKNGRFILNARKFYTTGSLLAHFVIIAAQDEDGLRYNVILDRHTPGLTVIDDWNSFGQRTTASGTLIADNVVVDPLRIIPTHAALGHSPQGALSQLCHVGIDVGIARAAIRDAIAFVRSESRPARDTNVKEAWLDPYTIQSVGDLEIRLHAAEAMTERAGKIVDEVWAAPDADGIARASIAVAEAKVLANNIALLAANKFFELAGTRSTLAPHAFDRHWRNARTHTVHDAVRWKTAAIGEYYLNGTKPIIGGQI